MAKNSAKGSMINISQVTGGSNSLTGSMINNIPISSFYTSDNSLLNAIDRAKSYLTTIKNGSVIIPANTDSNKYNAVKIFSSTDEKLFSTKINYSTTSYKHPTTELRPYTGDNWVEGDIIYNNDMSSAKCQGWICTTGGAPGTWMQFGIVQSWANQLEEVTELPDASILQDGRQVLYKNQTTGATAVYYCTKVVGSDTQYVWQSASGNIEELSKEISTTKTEVMDNTGLINYESTGSGIISGMIPTIDGLNVSITSGVAHMPITGLRVTTESAVITCNAADTTNPRIDLIYLSNEGKVSYLAGTASATPSVPALPANGISVATVTVAAKGSTGTIADMRGMLARWANTGVVNVKDFGAVGDGVADDTAALQAAINSGKKIILDGVFRITAPLNINNAINIQGTIPRKGTGISQSTSRILVDLTADGSGIVVDVVRGTKVAIRDLSIAKKTGNTHTINAMKFNQNTSDSIFENIVIGYSTNLGYGFEKGIVFADVCWSLCFTQISIYNCNAIGIEANNLAGTVFNRIDIFSTPIGIKSTNSSININQGDFDKCHIGVDAYGGDVCMRNVTAENYEATDGGLEKAYIRSDGTVLVYIDNPGFYNNGYDTYNLVSISNGTWDTPIIIDNYHYTDTNRLFLNVASSCKQGCVKFVNFTTKTSLPSGFRSPYVCMNGEYPPQYMPDSSYFPGSLTCTLVGYLAKHYKGYVDKDIGDIVLFSTSQSIEGTIRHISRSGVETVGVIDGTCYPTPSSFSAVQSDSNRKLTISTTSGYLDIDVIIRSGYATPSDYPVY
jgi:hypothetical protein